MAELAHLVRDMQARILAGDKPSREELRQVLEASRLAKTALPTARKKAPVNVDADELLRQLEKSLGI
jgi:hypothetical protein